MIKKDRKEIFALFCQVFSGKEFEVISGLNPCIIKYNSVRYNIYIKNLTPAQLSNNNPDIWRCQLPKRDIFDDFKTSRDTFILLGYDASNDVFATWNPFWAKQRLNIGESVSMYSRYSIQKEAAAGQTFIQFDLNHKGIVIVFPRILLCDYIDNISMYFSQETTYKAIGSSLRKDKSDTSVISKANETFRYFSSKDRIERFHCHIQTLSVGNTTKNKYKRAIRHLFEDGLITKYQYIFEKYDDIIDYDKAINEFLNTDEINFEDRRDTGGWHGYIMTSLRYYLESILSMDTFSASCIEAENQNSKIPNICTPDLVEKIAPLMCKSEPQLMEAMEILYETFGDIYQDSMLLNDWLNLLKSKNWALLSKTKRV